MHVINAVMECIEAMRISLGPTRVLQHTLQVSLARSISLTRLRGSTDTCSNLPHAPTYVAIQLLPRGCLDGLRS